MTTILQQEVISLILQFPGANPQHPSMSPTLLQAGVTIMLLRIKKKFRTKDGACKHPLEMTHLEVAGTTTTMMRT